MVDLPTEAEPVKVIHGDCLDVLRALPDGCVDAVVTSPPYWELRRGQTGIGSEPTVAEYVSALLAVFTLVRRKLADSGSMWLNLGDTYRNKRLQGVPWRVALALQDAKWLLRGEVIWAKGTHKPEKVKDRPTRSHEHMFLMTKRGRYYYDWRAEAEIASGTDARPQHRRAKELASEAGLTPDHIAAIRATGATDSGKSQSTQDGTGRNTARVRELAAEAKRALGGYYREFLLSDVRNCRSVWHINPDRNMHAHTATMPAALAKKCVRLSARSHGIVLDPFGGSGTTAVAALHEGRRCLIVEKDAGYCDIIRRRVAEVQGVGAGPFLAPSAGLFDGA